MLTAAPAWCFDGVEFSADSPLVKSQPLEDMQGLRFIGADFVSSLRLKIENVAPDRRLLVSLDFTNVSKREIRLERLSPIRGEYRRGRGLNLVGPALSRLQHVLNDVWILTDEWERVNDWNTVCEPLRGEEDYYSPWDVAVWNKKMDLGLFAGIAGPPKTLTAFRVLWSRHQEMMEFSADSDCRIGPHGVRVPPGATFASEPVALTFFQGNPYAAVERCTARLGDDIGARIRRPKVVNPTESAAGSPPTLDPHARLVGYCDWYWSYGDIDQNKMDANRRWLAERWPGKLKVFQLDDGWQWVHRKGSKRAPGCIGGPWTMNERFSGGMNRFARMATADGFVPGLWLRPFSLDPNSELAQANPDWYPTTYATDVKPGWWAQGYRLDISSPAVLAHITEFINRAVKSWGMRYLKLDFLTVDFYGASGWSKRFTENPLGGYRDETKTGVEIYTNALATIREAAGEDCYITGCNTLIMPGARYFDGQRTGNDVSVFDWEKTVREGFCPLFLRAHHHMRLYQADPDCVLLRDPFSIEEAKTWTGAVALSGQPFFLSENMPELPAMRTALQEQLWSILERPADACRPVDVFEDPRPRLLFSAPDLLGVFNYTADVYEKLLPVEKLGFPPGAKVEGEDVWEEIRRPLSPPKAQPSIASENGLLPLRQAPRTSRIWRLRRVEKT